MTATAVMVRDADGADPRLPTPVDKAALKAYLVKLEDPEALKLQGRLAGAYDAACTALLGKNDIQKADGREFKKKSAWRKLARYFGISTVVTSQSVRYLLDEATGESVLVAECTVRGTSPWGQSTDAVGACGSDEEKGSRKISVATAIATASTRADNRAVSNLVAMGEVSHEEMTRAERDADLGEAVAADMTLEEARALPFPWRQPEKYRGKPLGALSARMLTAVLDAVSKDIETKGATPARLELQQAATLCLGALQALAALVPIAAAAPAQEPPGDPGPASETNGAPEPTQAPPRPTAGQLTESAAKLIRHQVLTDEQRTTYRGWLAAAATSEPAGRIAALKELIAAVEQDIAAVVGDEDEEYDEP